MTDTTMTLEQQLAKLQAENDSLKAKAASKSTLSCKVSQKGAISVYGLGRWPVTLYRSQMERFLSFVETGAVKEFIDANVDTLTVKE